MIGAVKTRLEAQVPELAGKLQGAADWAEAIERTTVPDHPFFGYLVPTGFQGREPSAAVGRFIQSLDVRLSVVLGFRSRSATFERSLTDIDDKLQAVMTALCGWSPEADTPGVFQVESGAALDFRQGAFLFQLNFTVLDQLRVTP